MASNMTIALPIAPRVFWNGRNRDGSTSEYSERVVHLTFLSLRGKEPRCHITFRGDDGSRQARWVVSESLSVVGDLEDNCKTWVDTPLCF